MDRRNRYAEGIAAGKPPPLVGLDAHHKKKEWCVCSQVSVSWSGFRMLDHVSHVADHPGVWARADRRALACNKHALSAKREC